MPKDRFEAVADNKMPRDVRCIQNEGSTNETSRKGCAGLAVDYVQAWLCPQAQLLSHEKIKSQNKPKNKKLDMIRLDVQAAWLKSCVELRIELSSAVLLGASIKTQRAAPQRAVINLLGQSVQRCVCVMCAWQAKRALQLPAAVGRVGAQAEVLPSN